MFGFLDKRRGEQDAYEWWVKFSKEEEERLREQIIEEFKRSYRQRTDPKVKSALDNYRTDCEMLCSVGIWEDQDELNQALEHRRQELIRQLLGAMKG